jgi:hypothetical protein
MRKKAFLGLPFLATLLGSFGILAVASPDVAFAKPPDWAPAHGYRRKHQDDDKQDRWNRDEADDWRKKFEDELEQKFPHYADFRALDENRDGRISLSEWTDAKDLFERLDQNHDGALNRTEYARIDEERGWISGFFAKIKEKVSGLWAKLF